MAMRVSVRTYLAQAKRQLEKAGNGGVTRFVVGNESADLDSIASALVYGYIQSSRSSKPGSSNIVIPVTNIPATDLSLRPELTALLRHADLKPDLLITLDDVKAAKLAAEQTSWTLVDHNVLTGVLAETFSSKISGVIDHHDDEGKIAGNVDPRLITKAGSCSSLVANHCRPVWDEISSQSSSIGAAIAQDDTRLLDDAAYTSTWSAQVAKLALGAVLIDTVDMTDKNKVTEHDQKALKYLEALINIAPRVGKDYDRKSFFQELMDAKADIDDLSIRDILRKDYKEWTENGRKLGTAVVVKPLRYMNDKSDNLAQDFADFGKERELQFLAVTTAFDEDSNGGFGRELALICFGEGKDVDIAEHFAKTASGELELEDSDVQLKDVSGVTWQHTWRQHNLAASRKRVAPLLREAMRS